MDVCLKTFDTLQEAKTTDQKKPNGLQGLLELNFWDYYNELNCDVLQAVTECNVLAVRREFS